MDYLKSNKNNKIAGILSLLEKVSAGEKRLDSESALQAFKELPLPLLFKLADRVRQRLNGNICTFIIDRNINYTNVCEVRCYFCAFSRDENEKDAYTLSPEEILLKVSEAKESGATQVMIQGGLNRKTNLSYLAKVFKSVKRNFPEITIHSLSAPEIEFLAKLEGISFKDVLQTLKDAGLDSLPGGGAEILVDDVRMTVSPKKTRTDAWLKIHEEAHRLGLRSTATMVIGHKETIKDRVTHLLRIRDLQDKTGGFMSFIPWIYHPGKTKLGGGKTTAADYLRTLSIARLFLDNIKHLQASWLTVGKAVGQMALHAGADDLGSLMLEENVVRSTGHQFVSLKVEEMIHLIKSSGRKPAQRLTDFSLARIF